MRLLNFLKIGCTMLVLLSLIGCAYNSNSAFPSNEEAQKARIEQLLNRKYGDNFTVHTISAEHVQQAFDSLHYVATVSSDKYNGTFNVRIDKKETLVDDYPRLYFGEKIESKLENAIKVVPTSYDAQWEIRYPLSINTWKNNDSLNEYIEQERVYASITLQMGDKSTEEVIDAALALHEALQAEHIKYTTMWESNKAPITVSDMDGFPSLSEQDITDKFERDW